jgi:ABC-type multidrug transport system permease subunit
VRAFLVLTRQRLNDVLRKRSATAFVVLFPVVLMLVVGFLFMNGHPFELRKVAVVGEGPGVERVVAAIATFEEIRVERGVAPEEALGKLRARMLSAVIGAGSDGAPTLTVGPRDELFGRGVRDAAGGALELSVLPVPRFGYVHYLFAGLVTFSIVVSGLFATGYTMVLYRQNRFLKKLATTPLPKITFVLAVVTGRGILILAQVVLMVVVGALVFDVPFAGASLLGLAAVTILGLFAFMGIGFVLACLIKSDELIVDVISAVNMPLVLLSEIFFPLDALPGPLALIGRALPSTEVVRLWRAVLLYGADAQQLAGGMAVLALWVAVTFGISLVVFRWHG